MPVTLRRGKVTAIAERHDGLVRLEVDGRADKRTKDGVVRWSKIEPRSCERCGRPVRGRVRLCGSCTVAVMQE